MQKRNVVSIGFLLLSSMIFLTCYGWGAEREKSQEAQAVMKEVKKEVESPVIQNQVQKDEQSYVAATDWKGKDEQEQISESKEEADRTVGKEEAEPEGKRDQTIEKEEEKEIESLEQKQEPKKQKKGKKKKVKRYGCVKTKAVNVRVKPLPDAKVKCNLEKGESFLIVDETFDGWYQIEMDGIKGYVYSEYIEVTKR